MIRMTVTVDDDILEEARSLLKAKSKRDTIETALKEVIKLKKRDSALHHCGNIELDLDQETLNNMREQQ